MSVVRAQVPVSGLIAPEQQTPHSEAAAEGLAKEPFVRSPLSGRRYLLTTLTETERAQVTRRGPARLLH